MPEPSTPEKSAIEVALLTMRELALHADGDRYARALVMDEIEAARCEVERDNARMAEANALLARASAELSALRQELEEARAERDFLYRVFRLGGFDRHPEIWWRTDGEYAPVTIFVNCNDLFWWASADCERLTPENIGLWEQAYSDLDALLRDEPRTPENQTDGPVRKAWLARGTRRISIMSCVDWLFCARVRGMRPQGACYPSDAPEVWPLFDACGPERPTGHGNPCKPGEYVRRALGEEERA